MQEEHGLPTSSENSECTVIRADKIMKSDQRRPKYEHITFWHIDRYWQYGYYLVGIILSYITAFSPVSTISKIMDEFYLFANCNFVPDKYAAVSIPTPPAKTFQFHGLILVPVASRLRRPCDLRLRERAHNPNILLRHSHGLCPRL